MLLHPKLIGLAIAIIVTSEAHAGYAITYDFTGLSGATVSVPPDPATVPSGVGALPLARGFGLTPIPANNAFDSINWQSFGRDDNQYYAFTILPGSAVMNLASLVFTDHRSGAGPQSFEVDYTLPTSLNFNLIGTYTLGDTANHRESFDLSAIAELQGLTQAATFYIFGFNTASDDSVYGLGNATGPGSTPFSNNLILSGDIQGVPEPSGIGLAGTALVLLSQVWYLRRSGRP